MVILPPASPPKKKAEFHSQDRGRNLRDVHYAVNCQHEKTQVQLLQVQVVRFDVTLW